MRRQRKRKRIYRWGFVPDVRFEGYSGDDVCVAASERYELNISSQGPSAGC